MKTKGIRVKKDRRKGKPWGTSQQLHQWGTAGGKRTLQKKGKKYFAKIAKMRKRFNGGRPLGSKDKAPRRPRRVRK